MDRIVIREARQPFRYYLNYSDSETDDDIIYRHEGRANNGVIDDPEEAELTADEFCRDNYGRDKQILDYLASEGFDLLSTDECSWNRRKKPIKIAAAPPEYRPYMVKADQENNSPSGRNGLLDSYYEIKAFLEGYLADHIEQRHGVFVYVLRATKNDDLSLEFDDMETTAAERNFRILFTPAPMRVGWLHVNYGMFSEEDRYVPPHDNDVRNNPSAETEPVQMPRSQTFAAFSPSLQISFDLWRIFTLGYQYAPGFFDQPDDPYPPQHRQRYVSPEDAYTFAGINRRHDAHYFTVGFYPYVRISRDFNLYPGSLHEGGKAKLRETGYESSILVEGGLALTGFDFIRGWDRWSSTETMDKKSYSFRGAVGGIYYQYMGVKPPNGPNMAGGIRLGFSYEYYNKYVRAFALTLGIPIGLSF